MLNRRTWRVNTFKVVLASKVFLFMSSIAKKDLQIDRYVLRRTWNFHMTIAYTYTHIDNIVILKNEIFRYLFGFYKSLIDYKACCSHAASPSPTY